MGEAVKAYKVVVAMPYKNREEPDAKVQVVLVPEEGFDAIVKPFAFVTDEEWRKAIDAKPGWFIVLRANGSICHYPPDVFEAKYVLDPDGEFI